MMLGLLLDLKVQQDQQVRKEFGRTQRFLPQQIQVMLGLTQKLVRLSYTMTTIGLKLVQPPLDLQDLKVLPALQDLPVHKVFKDRQDLRVLVQLVVLI
jgi:hypothetical protein